MARHTARNGVSITYRWRGTRTETPRWLDLHPVVDNWRGPRPIVVAAAFLWRHAVRSDCVFNDGS